MRAGAGRHSTEHGHRLHRPGPPGPALTCNGDCGERGDAATARLPFHGRRLGYFIAPAVSPDTTCRWKMMYAASTGSIAITRPAKSPDQSPL